MQEAARRSTDQAVADVIAMSGVRFAWPGRQGFALWIPEFRVERGARLLLTGPSGSGKTTLLNLLCGIATANAGKVEVLGTELGALPSAARDRFRAEHIGVIFQMFNLLPYGSVVDNVVLPLSFAPARRRRAANDGPPEAAATQLLTSLGLDPKLSTEPAATLSIGQQQRVAAARALIGAPEIIVADEPTSALDRDNQERFLDLLFAQIATAGATLVMVSHDQSLGHRFDRVIDLGDLIEEGSDK